jgi:hypothetical protein
MFLNGTPQALIQTFVTSGSVSMIPTRSPSDNEKVLVIFEITEKVLVNFEMGVRGGHGAKLCVTWSGEQSKTVDPDGYKIVFSGFYFEILI